MECEQLLKALNEYMDGHRDAALCREFERHLAGCTPCQVVVDNLRKTIRIFRNGVEYELPEPFHRCLHEKLHARWAKLFPGAGTGAATAAKPPRKPAAQPPTKAGRKRCCMDHHAPAASAAKPARQAAAEPAAKPRRKARG